MARFRSLRRRRSWLEVGFVGCSMLGSPAQAAWLWSGTVWPPAAPRTASSQHHPAAEPPLLARHGSPHHATPAAAEAAAAAAAGASRAPPRENPASSSPRRRQLRGHEAAAPPPPSPSRALDVKITLHASLGDWEECSPETCTQTRPVYCETAGSRIVASDLCGDELPASERACVGADAAVCGEGAAAADGSATDAPGREGGAAPAAEQVEEAAAAAGGEGWDRNRADSRKPRSSAKAAAPAGPTKASKVEEGGGATEEREGGEQEQRGGGAARGSSKTSSGQKSSKVSQSQKPSGPSTASTPASPPDPSLAANQASHQSMAQMGGGRLGQHRLEYRFWVVLAIGAGAVGSFMAAVVFAVGQYRKERHRLRGIMALNEFPQDAYINPFAKQLSTDLSEDDRSAFKL